MKPALLILAGLTATLAGCAANDRTTPATSKPAAAYARTLQVSHVNSETRRSAGFPCAIYHAITLERAVMPLGIAVVESRPMINASYSVLKPAADGEPSSACAVLFGRGFTQPCNMIDPQAPVHPGDEMLAGGFVFSDQVPAPKEFWSYAPANAIVKIISVESDPADAPAPTLPKRCRAEALGQDYTGFIGGPVAAFDDRGRLRVWGIVTAAENSNASPTPNLSILTIERLPPELGNLHVK